MAALFPAKLNSDRTTSYPDFRNILNLRNMSFPVTFSDITIFEKNNKEVSINIYGLNKEKKIIGPLYRTQHKKRHHINLLFLENETQTHYCLIKDLGRLVRSQITKHHSKIYFCDDCLLMFTTDNTLYNHVWWRGNYIT